MQAATAYGVKYCCLTGKNCEHSFTLCARGGADYYLGYASPPLAMPQAGKEPRVESTLPNLGEWTRETGLFAFFGLQGSNFCGYGLAIIHTPKGYQSLCLFREVIDALWIVGNGLFNNCQGFLVTL